MRYQWLHPQRLTPHVVQVGEHRLGRTRVDARMRIERGAEWRTALESFKAPDTLSAIEIRMNCAKDVRDQLGGTTTKLEMWIPQGDEWTRWTFTDVSWRRSCCRAIGLVEVTADEIKAERMRIEAGVPAP